LQFGIFGAIFAGYKMKCDKLKLKPTNQNDYVIAHP